MSTEAAPAREQEPRRFELGREVAPDGRWVRQRSVFRDLVTADGSSGLRAESGRYHLYVALACPWSHRAVIGRVLKGLESAVSISHVDPFRDARGWAFTGGEFVDTANGFSFLREAYLATDPTFEGRVSVPVLWDRETQRIVNNDSADILRMFETQFDAFAEHDVDLYPQRLRTEVDALNELIYDNVNDGVYKAGFSRSQAAYEEAYRNLFAALDRLEERLASTRFLLGDEPTEADWRLFPTFVRFDPVYYIHFKCSRQRLVEFEHLWGYTRDLYQRPGIAGTVAMDQIKRHYYTTHDMINPSRLVPLGPEVDFTTPHGRG